MSSSTMAQRVAVAINAQRNELWPALAGFALFFCLFSGYFMLRPIREAMGISAYSLVALTLPLFAGMASMLRFVAGLAPMPLMLAELLSTRRWLWLLAMIMFPITGYFTTIGWLNGVLTLV